MKWILICVAALLTGCAASDWDDVDWDRMNQVNRDLEQRYRRDDPPPTTYSPPPKKPGDREFSCINGVVQPGHKGCGATPR